MSLFVIVALVFFVSSASADAADKNSNWICSRRQFYDVASSAKEWLFQGRRIRGRDYSDVQHSSSSGAGKRGSRLCYRHERFTGSDSGDAAQRSRLFYPRQHTNTRGT